MPESDRNKLYLSLSDEYSLISTESKCFRPPTT